MKKITIITTTVASVVLVSAGFLAVRHFTGVGSYKNGSNNTAVSASGDDPGFITTGPNDGNSDYTYIPPTLENDGKGGSADEADVPFVPNRKLDTDPTSITVLVNKEYALPKDYVPANMVVPNVEFDMPYYDERKLMRPEAAEALENLFAAAQQDGYNLVGVSGYRSYNRQYQIFTNNIVQKGKTHTLEYSAVPGTSEHQTGLSIDVTSEALHNKLEEYFATTPEGIWLSTNAHKYGFIIRYPKDKVDITGYAYEPWHIRYVGKGLANYLYKNNLTLDEYYNYKPSKGFNFEKKYAAIINYKPPTPTPTPTPVPTLVPSPSISPTPSGTVSPTVKPTPTITGTPGNGGSGKISTTPKPTPSITPTGGIPSAGDGQDTGNGSDTVSDGDLLN